MFWERFTYLCDIKGESPNTVAANCGIKSSGTVTGWKNGAQPRPGVLKRIADYFGVSVQYFSEVGTPEEALGEVTAMEQILEITDITSAIPPQNYKAAIEALKPLLEDGQKNKVTPEDDLVEELEILRENPETRALLHATKNMKPEQIQQMVAFIKGIKNGY